MNIENKIKEVADIASDFDLEDTRKAWENKSNDVEYCVRVSDAIRIAKEYAEEQKSDLLSKVNHILYVNILFTGQSEMFLDHVHIFKLKFTREIKLLATGNEDE